MRRQAQSGFGLVNVLASVLLFSFGLLGMAGVYAKLTGVASQNQNLTQMVAWGNGFWGAVQANPSVLTALAASSPVTYSQANVGTAPASLQSWLKQIVDPTTSPDALANSQVVITTGPDAAANTPCGATTGCSVQLQIVWLQVGGGTVRGATVNRTQTFNYQFGV